MKLTTIPTKEYLAAEVSKTKAFVDSANAVEQAIDNLETVIASCRAHSGIQSAVANNCVIGLLAQLRYATQGMFLSAETRGDGLVPVVDCEIPVIS